MKNKPDMMHNNFMEDNYASLMGQYIQEKAQAERPPAVEREVLRAFRFSAVGFDYTGRAMELPQFTFQPVNTDDKGGFVPVLWGYSSGHHSVSEPILFKDRRAPLVSLATANADALKRAAVEKKRSVIQSELADITEELGRLTDLAGNRDVLERLLEHDIDATQLAMRLHEENLDASERALIEALVGNDQAQLRLLAPDILQKQIEQLQHTRDRVESLLSAFPLQSVLQEQEGKTIQDVRTLFTSTPGNISEIKIHNPVAGKPTVVLELTDLPTHSQTDMGDFQFVASGLHIPKPIPLAYIALGELVTFAQLQPEEVFGQETVGSSITKQNGIYRYIHFSSRTGRHSGSGYVSVVPKEV